MNSLTMCSEESVCWDDGCNLCYDPLEQHHGRCPGHLAVRSCTKIAAACQPILCWPKVKFF